MLQMELTGRQKYRYEHDSLFLFSDRQVQGFGVFEIFVLRVVWTTDIIIINSICLEIS
jgi:hypothetical protein